jgi:hypothetical protein
MLSIGISSISGSASSSTSRWRSARPVTGANRRRRAVGVSPGAAEAGGGGGGPSGRRGNFRLRSGLERVLNAVARAFLVLSSTCHDYKCLNRERTTG